jgi:hypothetical protein
LFAGKAASVVPTSPYLRGTRARRFKFSVFGGGDVKSPSAAISIADMTNVDTSISIANRPSHLQAPVSMQTANRLGVKHINRGFGFAVRVHMCVELFDQMGCQGVADTVTSKGCSGRLRITVASHICY